MATRTEDETKVNDSFSVTIPAEVRKRLGVKPGDKVRWVVEEGELTVEVIKERYGAFEGAEPVDVGETDAVERTEDVDPHE